MKKSIGILLLGAALITGADLGVAYAVENKASPQTFDERCARIKAPSISPALPDSFTGKHEGNLVIAGRSFTLLGMVVGNVAVCKGATLDVMGTVVGTVQVDSRSAARIYGVVDSVEGRGKIEVQGIVRKPSTKGINPAMGGRGRAIP